MTKRMLIDASHPEETRVVVATNNQVSEFDYEIEDRKPLKGNIYIAKVTRVEPSLQAAFVEYGGNRHGFLPFSEIHPDYYRLPVADRDSLIAEERAAQRAADPEPDTEGDADEPDAAAEAAAAGAKSRGGDTGASGNSESGGSESGGSESGVEQVETTSAVETLADDEVEDAARRRAAILGRYKIQEVIKRRQVMLVQVVKEERGNKGAALSTYLSLAGRYCVLMPNTDKGGGISRKIANTKDRRRLKSVISELNIPEGMAVIVRTAGSNRTKAEIKRDYEYLLRLWDHIRETTLQSMAPSLVHEEANLIKRCIRDLYTRDMDEVLVQGEGGYKAAKGFMRSLMPSHAKKVQRYDDPKLPIFNRFQIETQLDNIHSPSVHLKSGGYVVMNQTEALVAIDVNSGKSTKERHIEETALKTNLEAADEVARQLRLRDLAGLIVIDFIDMDNPKNNREVEQRLKEAMKEDRARIQLGRISPFGLLELSRQRLRASVHETSTEVCSHCGGSGFVRSPESTGLHVLRALEEEGVKRGGGEVRLTLPTPNALYVLNEKRDRLSEVERRYRFHVRIDTDDSLIPPAYRLDRLKTVSDADVAEQDAAEAEAETEQTAPQAPQMPEMPEMPETAAEAATETPERVNGASEPAGTGAASDGEADDGSGRKRGKRGGRRKKRGGDGDTAQVQATAEAAVNAAVAEADADAEAEEAVAQDSDRTTPREAEGDGQEDSESAAQRRRRRGKRGGRRRSKRREDGTEIQAGDPDAEADGESDSDEAWDDESIDESGDTVTGTPAPIGQETAGAEAGQAEGPATDTAARESDAETPAKTKTGRGRKRGGRGRGTIAAAAEASAESGAAMAKARRDAEDAEDEDAAPGSEAGAGETGPGQANNGPRRRWGRAGGGNKRRDQETNQAATAETALEDGSETAPAPETQNDVTADDVTADVAATAAGDDETLVSAPPATSETVPATALAPEPESAAQDSTPPESGPSETVSPESVSPEPVSPEPVSQEPVTAPAEPDAVSPLATTSPAATPRADTPEEAEPAASPLNGAAAHAPSPEAAATGFRKADESADTHVERDGGGEATTPDVETARQAEAPFGEAAEPTGRDDLAERGAKSGAERGAEDGESEPKPRRRGWWQKLLN